MAFLVGCSARHSQVNGLERLVYRITRTYGSVPSPRPAPDYFGELVAQAIAFVAEPVDRLYRSRQWSVVETPGCPTTIGAGRPGSITIGNHFAHALANEGEVCESTHGPPASLLGDWSRGPPDVDAPGGPCRDPRGGSLLCDSDVNAVFTPPQSTTRGGDRVSLGCPSKAVGS